jgi:hypothetical protein
MVLERYCFVTPVSAATSSPERGQVRKSNATTFRRFGSSIVSIFSSFFTRLCTCAAFAAWVEKRSMNRCSLANIACWRDHAASRWVSRRARSRS